MTQYAFYFDSSACSGCKACQVACQDKHHLPAHLRWRRVYEVTGGSWQAAGAAWAQDVFAFNLSISCNHCQQPICVEVCPTQAMHQRADGLVVIDQQQCVGCQYCSWACPYEAPQYDASRGHMTKCNFCVDNLAAGRPPACVAACPLRVLDFGEMPSPPAPSLPPLPAEHYTQPALVVKPHPAAPRAAREALLGNAEEVRVPRTSEYSLVAFTLLAQLAVGTAWLASVTATAWLIITALMALGLLASLRHLGAPLKAWRALRNVRSSWLSREVWCASLFMACAFGSLITGGAGAWLADLCGLALLISMTQAYRLRTIPVWDHWTTTASFFVTALMLGSILGGGLIGAGPWWVLGSIGLVGVRQAIGRSAPPVALWRGLAIVALLLALLTPIGWWLALALAFGGEALARRAFYEDRHSRGVWRFSAKH